MFRIITSSNSEDTFYINIKCNDIDVFKQTLYLDLTGDRCPTFSPNYYKYTDLDFTDFILNIENEQSASMLFDRDSANSCNGIIFNNSVISFILSYENNTSTFFMLLTDENKPLIIADLKTMQKNINELIIRRLELEDYLEYNDVDSDDEKAVETK